MDDLGLENKLILLVGVEDEFDRFPWLQIINNVEVGDEQSILIDAKGGGERRLGRHFDESRGTFSRLDDIAFLGQPGEVPKRRIHTFARIERRTEEILERSIA